MRENTSELIRGSIERSKIVYLIVAFMVILGLVGLNFINKDEFPSFEITQGLVVGVYPGANSKEVKEQLTEPLEELLFSFPEVRRENTTSYSRSGMCFIYVDINCKSEEKAEVWSKLRLKLNEKKMALPPEVLGIMVLDDFSAVSSLILSLESPDKSPEEMRAYADELSLRLRAIPELASVTSTGTSFEEIAVTLDMAKLSSYGISPSSLMWDYTMGELSLPGGKFETDYVHSPIYIKSSTTSESDIADKIVYSDPSGNTVRLKDIARIERRYAESSSIVNNNGNSAIILSVVMRQNNDIVAFGEKVDKVLEEYSSNLPDSVHIRKVTDQPKVVRTSVLSFLRDLSISILVVIFVMLMLFPLRSALIASSGVPVCTAVALAAMFITGMDLNTVTLAALIVVLGMIVDDSIITMDGYMDKLGKTGNRLEAACISGKELIFPMFMATFAISAMFFPIKGIITGYLGDFVQLFPWVIAIALGASLAYAVFVVPSLEVRFIKTPSVSDENLVSRAQKRFFNGIQKGYEWLQAKCFRHPAVTITTGVVAVGLGLWMFSNLNVQMMPKAVRECFAIEIYLDGNSGISHTREVSDSLQKLLLEDKRVKSVTAFIGTGAPRFHAPYAPLAPAPNFAQLIVNTVSSKDTENMLAEYEGTYEHYFPNAVIRFKQMDYQGVSAPVEVTLIGAPHEVLKPYADSIKGYMATMQDELKWVNGDCDNYLSSINIELYPEEAARLGINKSMLSLFLNGTFNGSKIASVWEGKSEIPVNLYSDAVSPGMGYDAVSNCMIPTYMPGVSVPLRQVASVTPQWSIENLPRKGGEDAISVKADMRYGRSQPEAMKKIQEWIDSNIVPELPEGVRVEYGGLSSINKTVVPEILLSFICAVGVLFLFLLIHFKKISIAILTIVLSTLCFFGAFFGLWIFRLDFGITSVLGLISLVGIIVRNGIIMFDYAEELKSNEGISIKEAAEEAGKRRMRPIFLTSCTTALGVLPMIISGDLLWMPMGVVICFGTMLSIILITLVMPVSYWLIFGKTKKEAIANE